MNLFKRISLTLKIAGAVILALGIGIIGGCGKVAPNSPDYQQTTYREPFGANAIAAKWGQCYSFDLGQTINETMGNKGGHFDLETNNKDYKAKFEVPQKSLDNDVDITCTPSWYYTASGIVYVLDFGPDGLIFDPPATLEMKVKGFEDFNPTGKDYIGFELSWYDPENSGWELQKFEVKKDKENIKFDIHHFSRYAISGRVQ